MGHRLHTLEYSPIIKPYFPAAGIRWGRITGRDSRQPTKNQGLRLANLQGEVAFLIPWIKGISKWSFGPFEITKNGKTQAHICLNNVSYP